MLDSRVTLVGTIWHPLRCRQKQFSQNNICYSLRLPPNHDLVFGRNIVKKNNPLIPSIWLAETLQGARERCDPLYNHCGR